MIITIETIVLEEYYITILQDIVRMHKRKKNLTLVL